MKIFWQLANALSLLFALVANFLVGAQLLDLPSINEISDKYATYLTPAGYAFSIWSIIYVLLIVLAVYQMRDLFNQQKENQLPRLLGPWFIIANICNGLWTYVFVNELIWVSVGLLLTLTGSLYILLWRLKIAVGNPSVKTIVCVWWPLMLYAGWVTVATVVNVASWLESLQVSVTPLLSNVVLIGLGVLLVFLLIKRNVRELLLACTWGVVAIGVQQVQQSGDHSVAATAFTVASLLLIAVTVHIYIHRHSNVLSRILKKQVD